MKGTQDLKVVKDIHAKALLNAYYSNCLPLYQEGGKRKRKTVSRAIQLHKSGEKNKRHNKTL